MSAIKFIQPHAVYFHVVSEPQFGFFRYHEWWDDLKDSIPFLEIKNIHPGAKLSPENIVKPYGGYLLSWTTLLVENNDKDFDPQISADAKALQVNSINFWHNSRNLTNLACEQAVSIGTSRSKTPAGVCVHFPALSNLHPMEITSGDDWFAVQARKLFYATNDPVVAKPNNASLVPLICHYILLGGNDLRLDTFLSMISCLVVVK